MRKKTIGAADMAALEARIGYTFQNKELAGEALTHASRSHESPNLTCNERLEFLGDSVLGMIVCDHLYRTYPQMAEGGMSKIKASVVSEPSLAQVGMEIGLPGLVLLGRGMDRAGEAKNASILSDAIEAIIAAIYLDAGLAAASGFILPRLIGGIEQAATEGFQADHKTRLQEMVQQNGEARIEYVLDEAAGEPHARTFTCLCWWMANGWHKARGKAKRRLNRMQPAKHLPR
jgi:ribonuclease-3